MAKKFHRVLEKDREFLTLACGSYQLWSVDRKSGSHTCKLCEKVVVTLRPSSRRRRVHLARALDRHLEKHLVQFPPRTKAALTAIFALGVDRIDAIEQALGFGSWLEFTRFMRTGQVFGQQELFR